MRTPADVSDAAYLIAHNHPGGVRVLAERMGVTVKTLANQRSAGTGPKFVKVGGAVRYPVPGDEA